MQAELNSKDEKMNGLISEVINLKDELQMVK